jgi:hypothetical protein
MGNYLSDSDREEKPPSRKPEADSVGSTKQENVKKDEPVRTPSVRSNHVLTQEEASMVVYKKLSSSVVLRKQAKGDEEKMRELARQLSTIDGLKSTYLATGWVETCNLYLQCVGDEETDEEIQEASTQKREEGFSSSESSSSSTLLGVEEIGSNERQSSIVSVGQAELASISRMKLGDKIRIKLLISETMTTKRQRAFRMLASPLLSSFKVFPELGIFHTALIIGPWKIEWNDSGLCIPRKVVSGAAVLTTDIDTICTLDRLEDVTDKLAHVIVKWNTTMKYKEGTGDKQTYGNCQDFIDDVMQELGLQRICEVMAQGELPVARFFRRLRETGVCTLEFPMDETFRTQFEIEQECVTFRSHADLDKFVINLLEHDKSFPQTHSLEWALLKSFDRAFWLKHYRYMFREEHAPLTISKEEIYDEPVDGDSDDEHDQSEDEQDHSEDEEEHPSERRYIKKVTIKEVMSCPFGDPSKSSFIGGR